MRDYPESVDHTDRVEPVPRRIRGVLGNRTIFDTLRAVYVWESPKYPQYYIPLEDVAPDLLVDENHPQRLRRGTAHRHGLLVGELSRPGSARVYAGDAMAGVGGTVRFDWDALDAWYEEDEQIFVHPRNPYVRVDALRSGRTVQVELAGSILARSSATVMVFETGLPTRYYFDPPAVDFTHLTPTSTASACPYKGRTSGYWSAEVPTSDSQTTTVPDVAWVYDFPTAALLPIAGLVAFYNEKVDLVIDGRPLERPVTPFS